MVLAEHLRKHINAVQACAILIVLSFVAKTFAALTYGPDLALFPNVYNQVFCPPHCWTFPTSIPYSIMWYYLNLFFLFPDSVTGRFFYGIYVLCLDAVTCAIFWKIKRIPKKYLALLQAMSVLFYLWQGSMSQDVSIIIFYPLMFFAAQGEKINKVKLVILAAVPILIKFPIGWSLPWVINEHIQCITACSGLTRGIQSFIMGAILNYGILGFAWYWTIQFVRGKNK